MTMVATNNMKRLLSIAKEASKDNGNEDYRCIYVDPNKRSVISSYRRQYDVGDLVVRITSKLDADFDEFNNSRLVYFQDKTSCDAQGIPGRRTENGNMTMIGNEEFDDLLQLTLSMKYHHILLNPTSVLRWIDQEVLPYRNNDIKGMFVTMQVISPMMTKNNLLYAKLIYDNVDYVWYAEIVDVGSKVITKMPVKEDISNVKQYQNGRIYLVELMQLHHNKPFVRVVDTPERTCFVKLSVQYFDLWYKDYLDRLGYAIYEAPNLVNSNTTSTFVQNGQKIFPAITSNEIYRMGSPYAEFYGHKYPKGQKYNPGSDRITFHLDTFKRMMLLSEHAKIAEIRYHTSDDRARVALLAESLGESGLMTEAVVRSVLHSKNGRVYTQ